jgi:glycosyltransferase involved in cell wall biosynthesis
VPQRKLLVFTTALGGGGAESHALRVMNHLDRARWQPVLAVTRTGGSYERFLAPDVRVLDVSVGRVRSTTGRLLVSVPLLRRAIARERPDLVLAVMDLPALAALAAVTAMPSAPPVVACVQVPPLQSYQRSKLGRGVVLPGIRELFPRAAAVISLSRGVADELATIAPSLRPLTTVIHNACVDERNATPVLDTSGVPDVGVPVVVAAGRLQPEKAYGDLLDAFAIVRARREAELWILGEGPERASIEAHVARLGLERSVRLLGFRHNPEAFMRRATVFVLSSLFEGFGNVIVEALAVGTPVVATDCPYGPGEILEHERSGLLVPVRAPEALAEALDRVLADPALRERLSVTGRERAQAFTAQVIAAQYADALDVVADRAARAHPRGRAR